MPNDSDRARGSIGGTTLTAYGLPVRADPLRFSYCVTATAQGRPRTAGDVFRDPTNGKLYVVAADGSLRRAQLVQANGRSIVGLLPRSQRQRRRRRQRGSP